MSRARLQLFQNRLAANTAALISGPTDITYLMGFGFLVPEEREAFLFVTKQSATLLHHSFSPIVRESFCQYLAGLNPKQLQDNIDQLRKKYQIKQLLVDKNDLVVSEWELLQNFSLELIELPKSWLAEQKMSKDEAEIAKLKKAGQVSTKAFAIVKEQIRVGQTEIEIAELLKDTMRQLGSEREAFPTIVAFGANSALPHHQPTNKKLTKNEAILIDFGATVENYRSDTTRSWWFGPKIDPEYEQIRAIVLESYELGVKALAQPQPVALQIDQAVRTHINAAHYGKFFIHTTGHGLGLDIHESPSLYITDHTPLPNHCVVTIEPGIYLPDKFGVRYENTLLLQDGKVHSLTGK